MKIYILSEFRVHGFTAPEEIFSELVLDNLCELNKYESTTVVGDKDTALSILERSNVLKYIYEVDVGQVYKK